MRAEEPRLVVGVPSHYRLLSQLVSSPLPPCIFLCSGGPLDPAIAEEFERRAGHPVTQIFGSTETAGIARRRGTRNWEPFPGLRWQSREVDGRLLIDAPWQDNPGTWFATDDVIAAEGDTFRLIGRADSVVKVGGRRFATAEIVQAALAMSEIEQAHALVYQRFGESAVALFVVPTPGTALAAADVRAALSARLAAFKVPRTIEVLAALPMRGIGKVDQEALRARVTG
jgi:acyl-coenzyme A synthetase/AMP-(fatty) acid ligase